MKRTNHFQWIGAVHEYLEVAGTIFHSNVAVTHNSLRHDTNRNLLIYEKQLANNVEFSPRDLFYFANELKDHQMYQRAIEYYEKFLLTEKGWIEDNISACSRLADCFFELGDHKKELESNLRSFQYDHPRPEFCCRLGFYFLKKKELHAAIFWYKLATEIKLPSQNLGCTRKSFFGSCHLFLPGSFTAGFGNVGSRDEGARCLRCRGEGGHKEQERQRNIV